MKKCLFITLLLSGAMYLFAQENPSLDFMLELGKTELTEEQNRKVNAAIDVAEAVQKTGNYVKSLTELFTTGKLSLPVGVKSDSAGYELIVHRISQPNRRGEKTIYATCAFRFKDGRQPIAFEGQAVVEGDNGLGTKGKLTLIAPVERPIGKHSTLIVRAGTSVSFECGGIGAFDANLIWMVTSNKIIPVDAKGKAQEGKPLGVAFNAHFEDFDNYLVSLNIDRPFMIKGLKDVFFTLKGATIDQSDTENAAMMRFPSGYFGQADLVTQKLWKGVAVTEASVSLPSFFKQPNSAERIVLALNDVLFDENGFTGGVSADNVIPSSTLNSQSWGASLTGFSIGILKNDIVALGLSGDINVPPFGKNSLLPYTAYLNPSTEEFEFSVNVSGDYEFSALRSTLSLSELSTIKIQYRDQELYPSINATGKLTVDAPMSEEDSTRKVFSVPDISFENLILSREAPYVQIGRIGVAGNLTSPKLAGFEVSLNDIRSFKGPEGDGLAFTGDIGLVNSGFALTGSAGIKLMGDYEHWKFNKTTIEKVDVSYESSAFSINGGVWFKNGDELYGDGFRGDIRLKLIDKFNFDAVGIFGKKDDFKYFLTDVFYETNPISGITVPPVLTFYGFGGGLYQRMQQAGKSTNALVSSANIADLNFGQSLSGINYVPDKNVGFGLMATAKFALLSSATAFNAKVGFEMQFNDRGGLNFVQLRGDGAFMESPESWGGLNEGLEKAVNKQQSEGKNLPEKAKVSELEGATPENKSSSMLSASMLFEYDNINDYFNADLSAYLNVLGIIKGIGANDRLGWAKAYISPNKWYFYLGTPYDPLGIEVLNLARLKGYFMLGDGIPALPLPPSHVILSAEKRAQLNARQNGKLGNGKGIALGAALDAGFDAEFLIFYAKMHLGLGAEFMLTNLNGQTCAGISGTPGINGWYAQAQAWAYVEAAIGLQARLFGKKRKFAILDLAVSTLLEGKGPNPFYFAGNVGAEYRVLGGLIKGKCNFEFELGEECKLVGGSPFGEDVIAQLTPGTGGQDINVFTSPQVLFNVPIEQEMVIDEDDGYKGSYRAHLEEFTIKYKEDGTTVSSQRKNNEESTVSMFVLDEPFKSQKEVELYAKVSFQKKEGNNWVPVKDGGAVMYEEKRATFKTGDRPKEIMPEHVAYSYPISRQYNFYPQEHNQGYLLLTQNYSYLFTEEKPQGFDQKLRVSTFDGRKTEKAFTYTTNSSVSGVKMEINFPLESSMFDNDKIYTLAIVNIPQNTNTSMTGNVSETTTQMEGTEEGTVEVTRRQATGSIANLAEKEIYALTFKTSRHNTFAEKIKSFDKKTEGWRDYVEPFVHNIKTNLREPELFDAYEMGSAGVNTKMINFTAQLDETAWYDQTFYKAMYQSYTNLASPAKKVDVIQFDTSEKLLTDDEINIGSTFGYEGQGIFQYSIPYWCAQDFYAIRNDIAKKRVASGNITQQGTDLLSVDFPPVVFQGDYPVDVNYVLPGKGTVTSTARMTMYNPLNP